MNVVVVGGGSAGWLSALYMRSAMPHAEVTVVQSSALGVIGVGEGTVPAFRTFLSHIGIVPEDLVAECGATFKLGVEFENWNRDGGSYFHPFADKLRDFSVPGIFVHSAADHHRKAAISKGIPAAEHSYAAALAASGKVDLLGVDTALHFDAARFIAFLERKGRERNVQVVDAVVVDVVQDEQGYVAEIVLDSGARVPCDFVVDASGQARRVIGEALSVGWVSRRDELPLNRAVPFWLPDDPNPKPYTRAVAMSSGWMWQIPVEGRVGAGCVFSDAHMSAEEAVREAEGLLGVAVDVRKDISFEAGESEVFWHRNVMAVGLSAAFVEPLEATSLWVTCEQLGLLAHFLPECDRPRPGSLRTFNRIMSETMEGIRSFLYLHYMTRRSDSEFWRSFRSETRMPGVLERMVEETGFDDFCWGERPGWCVPFHYGELSFGHLRTRPGSRSSAFSSHAAFT